MTGGAGGCPGRPGGGGSSTGTVCGPRVRPSWSAGSGTTADDGRHIPLDVTAGDTILFGKYSGQEIKLDGEDYLIMREDEVLAVIEGGDKKKK